MNEQFSGGILVFGRRLCNLEASRRELECLAVVGELWLAGKRVGSMQFFVQFVVTVSILKRVLE